MSPKDLRAVLFLVMTAMLIAGLGVGYHFGFGYGWESAFNTLEIEVPE